ncbi:MAG: bifunctional 23S rRNA (guanine(2069)-N(7))-methyltransferase RlmK/23S rRNA (guanine(2445)-N(2))-methyltransferase RlmL [Thermoleophilia bacterium]
MSKDTAFTEPSRVTLRLFATAARGLEPLLAAELRALGAAGVKESRAGCAFAGTLETAYRVCLWSRLASRVLLPLAEVGATDADDLYEGVRSLSWEAHLASTGTLAVDFTSSGSPITHTHYGALRVKDAIVDRLRDMTGVRPSVDIHRPDLRIYAHATADAAVVGLDLSGTALHRRGYRDDGVQGQAPLKENLAAAILVRAGWPEVVAGGGGFLDPMCGSGTLPIEAALMAGDVAPGLLRRQWGFTGWKQHEAAIWDRLLDEARARRLSGLKHLPPIVGFDADSRAVRLALMGVERAGLRGVVHVERRSLSQIDGPPFATSGPGLVVANPPYGERLGEAASLGPLYAELGRRLREGFLGWKAAVLTADAELARWTGLRSHRKYAFFNGALEVRLYLFELRPDRFAGASRQVSAKAQEVVPPSHGSSPSGAPPHGSSPPAPPAAVQPVGAATHEAAERDQSTGPSEIVEPDLAGGESVTVGLDRSAVGVEMLSNRLRKNLKRLRPWVRREGVTCYRLYDADLPEYAVAIDIYESWVHVQEYEPPPTVDLARAQARLRDVLDAIAGVLQVPSQDVFLKVQRRQRGASQYEAQAAGSAEFHEVGEGGLRFLVDFEKRLDTGLFLDHRPTRALIRSAAEGARFLNLFAYTGTATVYAAAGGARETTCVDLSGRYLEWAARNLALNGFQAWPIERWDRRGRPPSPDRWASPARSGDSKPHRHQLVQENRLVQADCLEWLQGEQGAYDLVFLDPPTFSNSKRMGDAVLDIQRDHVELIQRTVRLLAPGGILLFSTNNRRFRMDRDALDGLELEDLSAKTLPPDFARNPRIHSCWRIRAGAGN